MSLVCALAFAGCSRAPRAEEIWLFDNTRVFGLVRGATPDGKLNVVLHAGTEQQIPIENIIAIRFLGRSPLLVQSGVQEFRFLRGGKLRGQILQNIADKVVVQTALAGIQELDLGHMRGFVAMPMVGFVGRKAEDLVDSESGEASPNLDWVLDRRGSTYPCALSKLERTKVFLDYDTDLINKEINLLYLAGVRLADATRQRIPPWKGEVQLRISARDGSVVEGSLDRIYLGKWYLRTAWDPKIVLAFDLDEISLVQIQGGRIQYLSQLTPVTVKEKTVLSPPQPFQMDRGCQGEDLSISGKRYPWGIGVHADTELTFEINARFKEFHCDAGVASRMGKRGSVIFAVKCDGKEVFKSPVVRGGEEKPLAISVPVSGVNHLTLEVTNAGDLDLGDAANWGSARVVR